MPTMITPGECQGQIQTVSYGGDEDYAYRRIYDASDRTTEWSRASWNDIWDATPAGADVDFDPVNSEPTLPSGVQWEPCAEPA